MSFDYIQNYYKVPAERGRRVAYTNAGIRREGVIVGTVSHYLSIHFDGDKKPCGPFHATHGIEYLEMGSVPKLSAGARRYARYREMADLFDSFRQFLAYEKTEREAEQLGFNSVSEYSRWRASL